MSDRAQTGDFRYVTTEVLRCRNSPAQIRTLVRHGALVRIGRGIYVPAAVARRLLRVPDGDHLLRAGAAVARNSPAVLSHRSAALLHGIDLIGSTATVTITTWPGRSRRSGAGVHIYTTPLAPQDMMRRYGLPVTTPARTVIDLARTLPLAEGVAAADSAMRKRLTSAAELQTVLAAGKQRRGNAQAALVIRLADGRSESALESIARVAFRQCGLPAADLQVWLPPGQPVGRVDFYWEKYKTIAEVDGAMKYEDPVRAKAQLRRDKLLREAGYEVVHFDWREITTSPDQVAESVTAAFRRAASRGDGSRWVSSGAGQTAAAGQAAPGRRPAEVRRPPSAARRTGRDSPAPAARQARNGPGVPGRDRGPR